MSSAPLTISIVILLLVASIIAVVQPAQFFTEEGQLREFSLAHLLNRTPAQSKYTWLSLPVFLMLFSLMTYLLMFLTLQLVQRLKS